MSALPWRRALLLQSGDSPTVPLTSAAPAVATTERLARGYMRAWQQRTRQLGQVAMPSGRSARIWNAAGSRSRSRDGRHPTFCGHFVAMASFTRRGSAGVEP